MDKPRKREIILELPWPPSVNHYYVHTRRGIRISKSGKAFRSVVRKMIWGEKIDAFSGDVIVWIDLYPPDRRRRDLDNILKALLDAMQPGCYQDDSQIVELSLKKMNCTPNGRVIVKIEAAE